MHPEVSPCCRLQDSGIGNAGSLILHMEMQKCKKWQLPPNVKMLNVELDHVSSQFLYDICYSFLIKRKILKSTERHYKY